MDLPLDVMVDALEDAIVCLDERGTVLWLNQAATRRFACPPPTPASGLSEPASPALSQVIQQLALGELASAPNGRATRRVQLQRPGAEPVPLEASVARLHYQGRTVFVIVMRDVSVLLQMEKALYESRKTQALAALAGGIAHDFNNILTVVISQIDLAQLAPEFPPALREHLIYAQTSARRGAELINRLQTFSRQAKPELATIDLAGILEQVTFVLKHSLDPKIVVSSVVPAEKQWLALADGQQITQALLNLAINARDAMPQGGRLTLELAHCAFSAADARPPRKSGEFIRLRVGDTGRGMTPEVASRVFEPYFTTKDPSRGPGLGLSIAAAVVAEHAGWMEVESQPGAGSKFSLFLPPAAQSTVASPPAPALARKASEGKECILVVDDEELVRLVTKAVLAYRGYKVVEAADGLEALEKYSAAPGSFDLILMDMHMPRLNGYDALLRIRKINPQVKVILLSGGVHESDGGIGDLSGTAFLQKPFENQELVGLVRQMLRDS